MLRAPRSTRHTSSFKIRASVSSAHAITRLPRKIWQRLSSKSQRRYPNSSRRSRSWGMQPSMLPAPCAKFSRCLHGCKKTDMFNRIFLNRPFKQEGESPFWISFSDLMSALMSLFLLVMAVTLISVTKDVSSAEARKIEREKEIQELMTTIQERSRIFPDVAVHTSSFRIDLGQEVRFDTNRSDISASGSRFLRAYVPVLLDVQASALGRKWIRRIVVEGFTDQDGTYLLNLALSLQRSRSVVCVMFDPALPGETALSESQKEQIEDLFLVGGYSFNSMKASKDASRRVELKVDFWALNETR